MTANTYQCTPLRADILEIRLVTLLPDAPGQPLRLKIWHAQPEIPKQRIVHRKTAEELQATLPPGWTTVETNQYQYRFIFEKDDTEDTTWKHPDPAADPCWWQPLPESPPPKYQPTYEALSYVWGPPGEEEKAYIVRSDEEAHLSGKELLVRPNLANALKHFRHAHKPSIFWIDAICIDQTKTKERSLQVMHMAEIYRWAQRVVIWLGLEAEDSRLAISALSHLGRQVEISSDHRRYRSPNATERDWFRADCALPFPPEVWQAINHLFHREWWDRLWVWQEVQLANSSAVVRCGDAEMPWQCLRKAVICLRTRTALPLPGLRKRLVFVETMTFERARCSINLLLNASRSRKCFDPRDKIYGMLSIAGNILTDHVTPDYRESNQAAAVYRDVFIAYTSETNRLDLLASCESLTGTDTASWPSWVPDFSRPMQTESLYPFQLASGSSSCEIQFVNDRILRAAGVTAGVVEETHQSFPDETGDILGVLRSLHSGGAEENVVYPADGTLFAAYMWTIRAGYFDEQWPRVDAPSVAK